MTETVKSPIANLRALAQALIEISGQTPLRLPAGSELRVVSAAQGALLDFFAENPYCTIETLVIQAGDPQLARLRLCEVAVKKIKFAR